jgi:DNA-binding PadR family transcriptional regulator
VASGAPRDTIYGWWQKWSRLGLVTESESRKGRMLKIVSLEDVGIKVPKKSRAQKGQETTMSQEGAPQTTPDKQSDPEEDST